jgi:type II protein arginine methyltransferase
MITAPITTDSYHLKIQRSLQNQQEASIAAGLELPHIPALDPDDTQLSPNDSVGHIFALTSPWIALCSLDERSYDISLQVFLQEIAFAAFCGVVNVLVPGPRTYPGLGLNESLSRYARAIKEALNTGPYLQIMILLPMQGQSDEESLANLKISTALSDRSVSGYDDPEALAAEPWDVWDAWNFVRTICKFNSRLSVG